MKKIISVLLALVTILSAFTLIASAATGVQSSGASGAQISTAVCSIWYQKNGVETKYNNYNTIDAAFEGLRDLYVGPLGNSSLSDTNGNGLSDELYAAAGSPVIKLNGNFQGTYARPNWATNNGSNYIAYDMNKVITIVIDGAKNDNENYTITYGTSSAKWTETGFNYMAYYNFVMKNTNIVINRADATQDNFFWYNGYSGDAGTPGETFTTFENCSITENTTGVCIDSGCLFKMTGDAKATNGTDSVPSDKFNLTFKDTTIVSSTAVGLQVHWGADANISLVNSTWTVNGSHGWKNNNDALLKYYECGKINITIDGTSKLIGARGEGSQTVCLIRGNDSASLPVNITLEKGAELRMENTGSTITKRTYISSPESVTTITDNGAVYTASAADVKAGVTLHTVKAASGNAHVWYANGSPTSLNPYVNASASADVTLTNEADYPVADHLFMIDGASLRLVKGESGVRFTTFIDRELLDYLGDKGLDYNFGTLIAPTGLLGSNALTHSLVSGTDSSVAIDIPTTKIHKSFKNGETVYENAYHGAVIMPDSTDPESVYGLSLTARAYLRIEYPDGSSRYFYADHDKTNNQRSMHDIAKKLVELDAEKYSENEIIAEILRVMKPSPDEMIAAMFPSASVMNSGVECKEIVVTGLTGKDSVINQMINDYNFTVYASENKIAGAKYETVVLTRGSYVVTVYWNATSGEMRIMWEKVKSGTLDYLMPNEGVTGVGAAQIAQIGTERVSETDNPLNGMCYIVKLSDGRAIVVDGGFNNTACVENLISSLGKMGIKQENGKYVIATWIFSHGHGDHIGAFLTASGASEYYNCFDIESFMLNLPADSSIISITGNESKLVSSMKTLYPNAKRITPHAGLNYYFGNVTIEMLYTPELVYSKSAKVANYNDSSLIFKVVADGASALIFGDAVEVAAAKMYSLYESTAFASDILHITHHGLYTEANNGHGWTELKKVYEASGAKIAFLAMQSRYASDTRNGRFTVMVQWCNAGYQISYVMNEKDKAAIFGNTIEQAEYDQFVKEGKVTNVVTVPVSSLYGYDGVNKVTNEQGMVTYLGANESTPMATVFTLSGGEATLVLNVELYTEWTV